MAQGDGGAIVNISSIGGKLLAPNTAAYAASKAALGGLMMSLKNEIVAIDPYARVNVVEPGWTVTEMTRRNIQEPGVVEKVVRTMPVRQLGRSQDVARTAGSYTGEYLAPHLRQALPKPKKRA